MTSLKEILFDHEGKVTDKWALYVSEYERYLAPFRNKRVALLEIGVQNGGSLEIWANYFRRAKVIIGCDISSQCQALKFDDDRIRLVVGDAGSQRCASEVAKIAAQFDIIIDDGSHCAGDIIRAFSLYFSQVKYGGIYIIEDLHCSYWASHSGGLKFPYSCISFLKALVDILNHEHWGVAFSRRALLNRYAEQYNAEFDEDMLATIHSIEFMNSVCIIRREPTEKNALGFRVLAGYDASVESEPMKLRGQHLNSTSQELEAWTRYALSTEEQLVARINELESSKGELRKSIETAAQSISDREAHIAELAQSVSERTGEISALRETLVTRDAELASRDAELHRIKASYSWRMTRPFRAAARFVRGECV